MKLAFLILPVALFSACGPTKEVEPNYSYQQATALKPGATGIGTMKNAKETHWWRLEVKREGGLSVKVGGIRDIDFVLSAYDTDRRELLRVDETTVGGDEQFFNLGVVPGTYYLTLMNKNPSANNPTQEYQLETKFENAQGRERLPNFTSLSAQNINAGSILRGYYWPTRNLLSDDTSYLGIDHWFAIKVDQQGLFLLNIDVSEVPKIDPILEVYDSNGYKLTTADQGGIGENESLRRFGVRGPGKYMLRLRSKYDNVGNSEVPYDLMTELLPYQGLTEFEPNNQLADATPFELDTINGTIAPAGDQDWYKISFASDTKQMLRLELTGVPGMDLLMQLKDSAGNDLLLIDNSGKEQPEILTGYGVPKGELYLVVSEKTGKKSDSHNSYTLTKKMINLQPGLEWEPNNSSTTAQGIKLNESIDGYFAPQGDVDWYEFNVYQKGVIKFDLTGVINITPMLTLYDQEYRELASVSASKTGQAITLSKELDRGTYSVRLQATDPSQNNVRDKYSLRLSAQ